MNLIKILEADKENCIHNFLGVCQALGKSNVAAHLLLMQEVGTY
jgi:hypothetical protein